ncbi:uncharacterized protein LOC100374846 isoform X1 [Saccoglossus kowalevskii]|uniref:Pre-mRNA-splicing factor 38 n=1 Tax=Saccoglossus kowalevskii TaxID=10224 RepID=A0ABM0MQI4_SACKO|nr:PREDICTED: pre-mRNA-splicing factor 38B-like [Saccoglossus kowalevskii]
MEGETSQPEKKQKKVEKKNNSLPLWGNEKTMNLNPLILTNIQSSPYFKNELFKLKTYHEVIDEIYYKVGHLEPWEKGSRQTAGQTGMCGGVRGVGTGGIVSSAFCLLYKLFTLKLTRKQVNGLITHIDSPYIRALGYMYIRYTQPPGDLFDWYDEYLNDEEELDVKAGGGCVMTIGEMLRCFLTKLEWFSTLFPRIPVPIVKDIERRIPPRKQASTSSSAAKAEKRDEHIPDKDVQWGEAERMAAKERERDRETKKRSRSPVKPRNEKRHSRSPHSNRRESRRSSSHHRSSRREESDFATALERERERQKRDQEKRPGHSPYRERYRSRSRERQQSRSREQRRSRSREQRRSRSREQRRSRSREQRRSQSREQRRSQSRERRRSRSRDRKSHSSRQHRDRRPKSNSKDRSDWDRHYERKRGNSRDRSDRVRHERRRSNSRDRSDRDRHNERKRSNSRDRSDRRKHRDKSNDRKHHSQSKNYDRKRSRSRSHDRSKSEKHRSQNRSKSKHKKSPKYKREKLSRNSCSPDRNQRSSSHEER